MTVLDVDTMDELNELIELNDKVVIDFAAPGWCIPCQRFAPHFAAVAEKADDTVFVHVDIDKAEEIRDYYNVTGVPYVVAYNNQEVAGVVESRTAPKLVSELETLYS